MRSSARVPCKDVLVVQTDKNLAALLSKSLSDSGYRIRSTLTVPTQVLASNAVDERGRIAMAAFGAAGMTPLALLLVPETEDHRRITNGKVHPEKSRKHRRPLSLLGRQSHHFQSPSRSPANIVRVSNLQINLRTQRAIRAHRRLRLTRIEFLLLARLAAAMGKVVKRHTLEKEVWEGKKLRSNSLETTIYRLRAKVDVPFRSKLIHTAPERGYWLARLT